MALLDIAAVSGRTGGDTVELKPCPFCGSKAKLIIVPGYFKSGLSSSGWLVKCTKGCCNQMPYASDHDAEEAWNRRANDG